uniref:Uncharacterized protein n=1 Tax=viral metagenome TaxID=1070528 RepID=A0A6H1ZZX1_9ZZZZ
MEANRKKRCDFDAEFNGETWHIEMVWLQSNGNVAWYDGATFRNGVKFMRTFNPQEISPPPIT